MKRATSILAGCGSALLMIAPFAASALSYGYYPNMMQQMTWCGSYYSYGNCGMHVFAPYTSINNTSYASSWASAGSAMTYGSGGAYGYPSSSYYYPTSYYYPMYYYYYPTMYYPMMYSPYNYGYGYGYNSGYGGSGQYCSYGCSWGGSGY